MLVDGARLFNVEVRMHRVVDDRLIDASLPPPQPPLQMPNPEQ